MKKAKSIRAKIKEINKEIEKIGKVTRGSGIKVESMSESSNFRKEK